jgi:hypothetical protein
MSTVLAKNENANTIGHYRADQQGNDRPAVVYELSAKRFDLMQQINVLGTFLLTMACLPHLRTSAKPHVLTISPPMNMNPYRLGDRRSSPTPMTAMTDARHPGQQAARRRDGRRKDRSGAWGGDCVILRSRLYTACNRERQRHSRGVRTASR